MVSHEGGSYGEGGLSDAREGSRGNHEEEVRWDGAALHRSLEERGRSINAGSDREVAREVQRGISKGLVCGCSDRFVEGQRAEDGNALATWSGGRGRTCSAAMRDEQAGGEGCVCSCSCDETASGVCARPSLGREVELRVEGREGEEECSTRPHILFTTHTARVRAPLCGMQGSAAESSAISPSLSLPPLPSPLPVQPQCRGAALSQLHTNQRVGLSSSRAEASQSSRCT